MSLYRLKRYYRNLTASLNKALGLSSQYLQPFTLSKSLTLSLIAIGAFTFSVLTATFVLAELKRYYIHIALNTYSKNFIHSFDRYSASAYFQNQLNMYSQHQPHANQRQRYTSELQNYLDAIPLTHTLGRVCIYDTTGELLVYRHNDSTPFVSCEHTIQLNTLPQYQSHYKSPDFFFDNDLFIYKALHLSPSKKIKLHALLHLDKQQVTMQGILGIKEENLFILLLIALTDILLGIFYYKRFTYKQSRAAHLKKANNHYPQELLSWICKTLINHHVKIKETHTRQLNDIEASLGKNIHIINQGLNIATFANSDLIHFEKTDQKKIDTNTTIRRSENALNEVTQCIHTISEARQNLQGLCANTYTPLYASTFLKVLSKNIEQEYQQHNLEVRLRTDNCFLPIDPTTIGVIFSCIFKVGLSLGHRGAVISYRDRGATHWLDVVLVHQGGERLNYNNKDLKHCLSTIEHLLQQLNLGGAKTLRLEQVTQHYKIRLRMIFDKPETVQF